MKSLRRLRHTVVPIDVDTTLPRQLLARKISVAFIALHGQGGEDGTVQGYWKSWVFPIPDQGSVRVRFVWIKD